MIPVRIFHAVFFWLQDFTVPAEFFVYPYLTARGLLPYSEIIDHHFPGLFFLPVNFFTLNFTSPESFRLLALLTLILTSVCLAGLAKTFSADKTLVIQTIFLYSLWQIFFSGSLLWIDLFLPLFLLPGYRLFIRGRYFLSGLMFALALIFKQTVFLPLGYLWLFLPNKRRQSAAFLLPSVIAVIGLWLYFDRLGSGPDFIRWNFLYNFGVYARSAARLPGGGELAALLLPLGLFVWSGFLAVRSRSRPLLLLAGFIAVLAFPAFARYGREHLQPAVPFFVLLLTLVLDKFPARRRMVLAASIIWIGLFTFKNPPAGRLINFSSADLALYHQASQLSASGRPLAVLGASPIIYPASGTLPPGRLFFFPLPWLFSELESSQLKAWQVSPPDNIVFDPQSRVDGQTIFTSAPRLVEYLYRNYRPETEIAGKVIYTRL